MCGRLTMSMYSSYWKISKLVPLKCAFAQRPKRYNFNNYDYGSYNLAGSGAAWIDSLQQDATIAWSAEAGQGLPNAHTEWSIAGTV